MAELVLGPILRFTDETSATVWVETDAPCSVSVLDATARTFQVHGHHYALVEITGLEPGTTSAYEVALDDRKVWPVDDDPLPQTPPPRTLVACATQGDPSIRWFRRLWVGNHISESRQRAGVRRPPTPAPAHLSASSSPGFASAQAGG